MENDNNANRQPTESAPFVHLRVHSECAIIDSVVRLKPLLAKVAEQQMPAIALTDVANLFNMVKFYRGAIASGIKPIFGADVWLQHPDDERYYRIVLLCQNQQGFTHLSRLLTRAYREGQTHEYPVISVDWLSEETTQGLIALSGAGSGDLAPALLEDDGTQLETRLALWQRLFPKRFYLEIQRTGRPQEEALVQASVRLAQSHNLPLVATNDVCLLTADDFESHEARLCINQGYVLDDSRRPKTYSAQQYLRSPMEMQQLFEDLPDALANTVEIAKRCNVHLTLDKHFLPNFPVPPQMTVDDYLDQTSQQGLEKRYAQMPTAPSDEDKEIYQDRLDIELKIIKSMGFPGYFLIVADFIQWAKNNGVPVGPGRGSGAGSLVAYALEITDVDPITYDLLFERFLNPERVSMPDFDVDFCMEGRDRVIEYVAEKYGRDNVAQIITYGTMAAKAVIRDVGRVMGFPYGFVDKLAKLVPMEIGMTLKKALVQEEGLLTRYQEEEEVKQLLDLAMSLEGLTRNVGKHAGGVVIAPKPLTEFTPLYCEPDGSSLVTQFDKDDIEAIGLVKFDFLGLRTLTIIDWAVQAIKKRCPDAAELNIAHIPIDDGPTFELLKACDTTAVFQLESRGMKDLIKRLQPDCFDDIVALVALFRPGPLQSGMVDDYVDRKHGRAAVSYPHPLLEPILKGTYGVFLYQEQVMQTAQSLAGYTLGAADMLRRAMGKKKPEEMAKQREIFNKGAVENGIDATLANQIFDLMETFAGYGFNKSHSVAYALISYQTAYLKCHYPAEFMASVLSSDMDNTDKVVVFYDECRSMKLKVLAPDVNMSQYAFTVNEAGEIIYGLGAVKGIGQAAAEHIAEVCAADGPYTDLLDFCRRVDMRKLNRRVLEALARAGAFDKLGASRTAIFHSIEKALHQAEQFKRDQSQGQGNLFATLEVTEPDAFEYVSLPDWTDHQRLDGEKATLGLYLSGHPMQRYWPELKRIGVAPIGKVSPANTPTATVAGYVQSMRTLTNKFGKRFAFMSLEDGTGSIDIGVFKDTYNEYRELLQKDKLLIVQGEVGTDDYSGGMRLTANLIMDMDGLRATRKGHIKVALKAFDGQNLEALQQCLQAAQGGQWRVGFVVHNQQGSALLKSSDSWQVTLNDELVDALNRIDGVEVAEVCYG